MSQRASSSSSGSNQFTFVSGNIQSEARSHAMREHWKRRHKRNQEAKSNRTRKTSRTLLPRSMNSEEPSSSELRQGPAGIEKAKEKETGNAGAGIPAQLLCGMGYALSSSRPDPFQTCPVHLTSQHQRLLHHWIGTHAAMMFEELEVTEFNPMRDVWFPLDLSNASSFNCIMAHSAAHLAHLYAGTPPRRGTNSADALKYKIEAVRILRLWLADPEKELSDDSFAATVRLLTFERYWGTVADWQVHRDGLQRMIDAKGGVEALHENWRLELVVYLVSLMSRPSWLESMNNLDQISRPLFFSSFLPSRSSLDVQKDGEFKVNYVTDLVQVLGTLSLEARQGVGRCLLNLLYSLGNKDRTLLIDDGWTPDSLLSSMHGH
ncbi:hypothetical protein IFM61606_06063 [Aspergillus udagawae]|nr:hypothetical protein IFM61606_06063 [Aspergillus udagawae]